MQIHTVMYAYQRQTNMCINAVIKSNQIHMHKCQ